MTWRRIFDCTHALACGTLFGLVTTPAAAQTLGQGGGLDISWWRIVVGFLFCAALAVAAALLLRARMQGTGVGLRPRGSWRLLQSAMVGLPLRTNVAQRRLRLVETLRLGPQVGVCLIQVDGRDLLLSMSPQGLSLLAQDAQADPP